jgi:hypothetical protein
MGNLKHIEVCCFSRGMLTSSTNSRGGRRVEKEKKEKRGLKKSVNMTEVIALTRMCNLKLIELCRPYRGAC